MVPPGEFRVGKLTLRAVSNCRELSECVRRMGGPNLGSGTASERKRDFFGSLLSLLVEASGWRAAHVSRQTCPLFGLLVWLAVHSRLPPLAPWRPSMRRRSMNNCSARPGLRRRGCSAQSGPCCMRRWQCPHGWCGVSAASAVRGWRWDFPASAGGQRPMELVVLRVAPGCAGARRRAAALDTHLAHYRRFPRHQQARSSAAGALPGMGDVRERAHVCRVATESRVAGLDIVDASAPVRYRRGDLPSSTIFFS